MADTPLELGSKRQLFLDEQFFDSVQDVKLTVNPPKQDDKPVLVADQPWESSLGMYNTVLQEGSTLRMWYDVTSAKHGHTRRMLCYAESQDGMNWVKPVIGSISFDDSTENNIVAPSSPRASQQGATVFRDPHAPAAERYKLWTKYQASDDDRQAGIKTGLWAMVSPDGFSWELLRDGYPLNRGNASDTQSVCFWDEDVGSYVAFVRMKERPEGRQRTCSVGHMTSTDFRNWTLAKKVYRADEIDEEAPVPGGEPEWRPTVDFYVPGGMKIPNVPDAYVILPSAYYHWTADAFPSTMDVRLATSRDRIHFWQPPGREPFLRLGREGTGASGMLMANPWLLEVDDAWWLYYAGTGADHRGKQGDRSKGGIYRVVLRRDGFVSADAPYAGGEFTTPVLTFSGRQLQLNMDTSAGGWLQVELLTPEGVPIDGYSLSSADTIRGNSLGKVMSWQGNTSLADAAGRPVRLRFVMRSTKLYSFQFNDE